MPIAAPIISLITATIDEISCTLMPPTDPTYDHTVAVATDLIDGSTVTLDPAPDPSFTLTGLNQNRSYVVVAYAVDTSGDFSAPSNVVFGITNYEAPEPVLPDLEITSVAQAGLGDASRVLIAYSLKRPVNPLTCFRGDLVRFEYSFNGTFTDAAQMTPDWDHTLMSGITDLDFCPDSLIAPPQHYFVWDITKDVPDDEIHTYGVRLQGRLKGVNTLIRSDTVDIDRTAVKGVVGTVISGQTLDYSIFLWQAGSPVTGATLTVDTILDPDQTDRLGGAVVLTEDPSVPGKYDGSFTVDSAWPTGLWQINYNATLGGPPATFTIVDVEHFFAITSAAQSIASLTDPDLCLVYGTLYSIEQGTLSESNVSAVYKREPSRYDNVGTISTQVQTDDNGFFVLPLRRGVDATLLIPDLQYAELIKVPDQPAAEFRSIQVNQPAVLQRGPFGHTVP